MMERSKQNRTQTLASFGVSSGLLKNTLEMRAGILLVGVIALSAALRFALLGQHSLWFDEAWVARVIQSPWRDIPVVLTKWDNNPPLFYALLKAWSRMAGTRESALRMPSAFFSCLTVVLTYILMRRFSAEPVSLLGALLVGTSPLEIITAQEARMYPLLGVLVLASSLALLVYVERDNRLWWGLYVALSSLIIYTHYLGFLVLVAHGVWVIRYERGYLLRWLIGMAIASLLYIPWIRPLWHQLIMTGVVNRGGPPFLLTALGGLFAFGGSLFGMPNYFFTFFEVRPFVQLIILLPFLVVLGWGVRSFLPDMRHLALIGLPLVIVIGVPLVFSFVHPLFVPRWFSFLHPFYAILVSRGIYSLATEARGARKHLVAFLTGGLVVFSLPVLNQYYFYPNSRPYNWRAAAALVRTQISPGDLLLYISPEAKIAFTYYFTDPYQSLTIPTEKIDPGLPGHFTADEARGLSTRYPRVWFVVTPPFDKTKAAELRAALGSTFRVAEGHDFGGVWVYLLVAKPSARSSQPALARLSSQGEETTRTQPG